MLAILLVTGLLQQQPGRAPAPQRQATAAAFDSTTHLVAVMGGSVADVKSSLDLFRRAVFNGPDGDVLAAAAQLGRSCHWLDITALLTGRHVCRHCGAPDVRRALEGYRAIMPSVARAGARCSTIVERQSSAGSQREAARQLRSRVREIGNGIVAGLVPYERRLQVLREAAGWAPATPPPPTARPTGR